MASKIGVDELMALLRNYYSITMLIGSGLEYSLGLRGFYDYKPSRQKIIEEDTVIRCSSLSKNIIDVFGLFKDILINDRFQALITTSPYCLYRCVCGCKKLFKDKIIPLLGCFKCADCCVNGSDYPGMGKPVNYKSLINSIIEIMSSEALIITGFTPSLSPVNMLPLIAKHNKSTLFLVDTFYNPYIDIADYYVELSSYKLLKVINEKINEGLL